MHVVIIASGSVFRVFATFHMHDVVQGCFFVAVNGKAVKVSLTASRKLLATNGWWSVK